MESRSTDPRRGAIIPIKPWGRLGDSADDPLPQGPFVPENLLQGTRREIVPGINDLATEAKKLRIHKVPRKLAL